jgi:hypothetical protein
MEFTCVMNGVSVSVKCDESVVKKGEGEQSALPSHEKIGAFIGQVISGAHGLFATRSAAPGAAKHPGK